MTDATLKSTLLLNATANVSKINVKSGSANFGSSLLNVKGNNIAKNTRVFRGNTNLTERMMSSFTPLMGAFGIATTSILGFSRSINGLIDVFRGMVEPMDNITSMFNRIRVGTGTNYSNQYLSNMMTNFANDARSSFDSITQFASRLTFLRDDLDIGTAGKLASSISKANYLGGATNEETQTILLQLSQGIASNQLSGDELKAIREAGPALLKYMVQGMQILAKEDPTKYEHLKNASMGTIKDMGASGLLTGDVVLNSILKMADTIDKDFNSSKTTSMQLLNLIANNINKEIYNGGIVTSLQPIENLLQNIYDFTIRNNGEDLSNTIGNISNMMSFITTNVIDNLEIIASGVNAILSSPIMRSAMKFGISKAIFEGMITNPMMHTLKGLQNWVGEQGQLKIFEGKAYSPKQYDKLITSWINNEPIDTKTSHKLFNNGTIRPTENIDKIKNGFTGLFKPKTKTNLQTDLPKMSDFSNSAEYFDVLQEQTNLPNKLKTKFSATKPFQNLYNSLFKNNYENPKNLTAKTPKINGTITDFIGKKASQFENYVEGGWLDPGRFVDQFKYSNFYSNVDGRYVFNPLKRPQQLSRFLTKNKNSMGQLGTQSRLTPVNPTTWSDLGNKIGNSVLKTDDLIFNKVANALTMDNFKKSINTIGSKLSPIGNFVGNSVLKTDDLIFNKVANALTMDNFKKLNNKVIDSSIDTSKYRSQVFSSSFTGLKDFGMGVKNTAIKTTSLVGDTTLKAQTIKMQGMQSGANTFKNVVGGGIKMTTSLVGDASITAQNSLSAGMQSGANTFKNVAGTVGGAIKESIPIIGDKVSSAIDKTKSTILKGTSAIKEGFQGAMANVWNGLNSMLGVAGTVLTIASYINGIYELVKSIAQEKYNNIAKYGTSSTGTQKALKTLNDTNLVTTEMTTRGSNGNSLAYFEAHKVNKQQVDAMQQIRETLSSADALKIYADNYDSFDDAYKKHYSNIIGFDVSNLQKDSEGNFDTTNLKPLTNSFGNWLRTNEEDLNDLKDDLYSNVVDGLFGSYEPGKRNKTEWSLTNDEYKMATQFEDSLKTIGDIFTTLLKGSEETNAIQEIETKLLQSLNKTNTQIANNTAKTNYNKQIIDFMSDVGATANFRKLTFRDSGTQTNNVTINIQTTKSIDDPTLAEQLYNNLVDKIKIAANNDTGIAPIQPGAGGMYG